MNTSQSTTNQPLTVAYSPEYLNWQLGAGDGTHPTNPARAEISTHHLIDELGDSVNVIDPAQADLTLVRKAIESVHDRDYVNSVLDDGQSSEWDFQSVAMGRTAAVMFAGTQVLVNGMLAGDVQVGFNPQGAKHHAQFDRGTGFCVFNDMAWAAREFAANGMRPIYVDWDIHAGDGVQHMLADTAIPTLSVHNHSTYPYDDKTVNRELARADKNHTAHDEAHAIYNWGVNPGSPDDAFTWALNGMEAVIDAYQPDVILLAAGADGHGGGSNLGTLANYSYDGFEQAAQMVARMANRFTQGRVLIGGAGGYQPFDHTPRIWANVVSRIWLDTQPV